MKRQFNLSGRVGVIIASQTVAIFISDTRNSYALHAGFDILTTETHNSNQGDQTQISESITMFRSVLHKLAFRRVLLTCCGYHIQTRPTSEWSCFCVLCIDRSKQTKFPRVILLCLRQFINVSLLFYKCKKNFRFITTCKAHRPSHVIKRQKFNFINSGPWI